MSRLNNGLTTSKKNKVKEMGKTIGKVASLTSKSIQNRKGYKSGSYRTEVTPDGVELYHYGTKIADDKGYTGGYSASDRDAINTFFDRTGVHKTMRIKQGVLQSYGSGGIVRETGYARVHKGEMIIPARTVRQTFTTRPEYAKNQGQSGWFLQSRRHSLAAKRGRYK